MTMIRANAAILIYAEHMGLLTEDRPTKPGYEDFAIALAKRKAIWMEEERLRSAALAEPYNDWLSPT